ncbi:MAG: phospholipid carrier-dependent glycosyltransferase [Galbitalea sp.]
MTNRVSCGIMTAICGILAVVLLMLIAKYLFKSVLVATIVGLLMAIDGNAIVMSRVALLDNFVMFFALLGFGAVLLDRKWSSERLALWIVKRDARGKPTDWGPALWWRPWLILADSPSASTPRSNGTGSTFWPGSRSTRWWWMRSPAVAPASRSG